MRLNSTKTFPYCCSDGVILASEEVSYVDR